MLFRMSAEAETRRLTMIGVALSLCLAAVALLVAIDPFGGRPKDKITVMIDLPYVGQGVTVGSPVVLHGVTIGRVNAVSSVSDGVVRLGADLQAVPTADLTDTVGVDFRPANYFGVTGINMIPSNDGAPLRDGVQISTVPKGNFTLQALLARLGEVTGGVVTPRLISAVHKATLYTDALNPLIETMVIAANSVSQVQTASTEQLLRHAAGVSVAFPAFLDAATAAGRGLNQDSGVVTFEVSGEGALPGQEMVAVPGQPQSEEYWQTRSLTTLDLLSGSFFGALGKLLSSHTSELLPAVDLVKTLSDTVPALITPVGVGETLTELRSRLTKLYAGSPEQRALQVHIVLDKLPGVQAPINAMGGPS